MIRNPSYKAKAVSCLSNALLTDLDPSVRSSAAEALGKIGSEEAVPALVQALNDVSTPVRQKAAEALGRICSTEQLDNIDFLEKLNQILQTMSDKPNVQMQFNAPVYGAAGNVEGNQNINVTEQDFLETAAEIRQLLNQLAQAYPTTSEAIIVNTIESEIKRNRTLKARLLNALKSGGIEALKAIFNHPLVNVPVETIKGFLEAEG